MKKTANARIAELEEQVTRLTLLVEGRANAAAPAPVSVVTANGHTPVSKKSRRDLLKLAGAAAAGAAGVVALKTLPASAATGGPVLLGNTNNANLATTITETAASVPNPVFQVYSSNAVQVMHVAALAGGFALTVNANGGALGIETDARGGGLGLVASSDSGTAIRANSATGVVYEALGSGRIMQAVSPLTPSGGGVPTYAPAGPEQVRDANGMMWISGPGTYTNKWAPVQPGGIDTAIFTAVTNNQYHLTASDGATWVEIDPALTLTISPTFAARALLFANIDLWTANPGYNQDIGIFVQVNAGTDTLLAWKESGGFAGAFSPNAAFVHAVYGDFFVGTTYTIRLKWKTNKDARPTGATIYAAAGNGPAPNYSPTRQSCQLIAI
jgi:hypothetical protein